MPKTVNEEFRTIYRPPYTVDASASAKMLNKYYDARKDGEIVDVVTLTEPYNIIGNHAFDFCHVKELTRRFPARLTGKPGLPHIFQYLFRA